MLVQPQPKRTDQIPAVIEDLSESERKRLFWAVVGLVRKRDDDSVYYRLQNNKGAEMGVAAKFTDDLKGLFGVD